MWKLFVECYTKKYFNFRGRASRKEYISFLLFNIIVLYLLYPLSFLTTPKYSYFYIATYFCYVGFFLTIGFIPSLFLLIRRLHDINLSFLFVILINLLFIISIGIFLR